MEKEKLIEVRIGTTSHFLSEKAAKIAIGHLGGIEVKQLATPREILTKTLPSSIKPVILIEPPEVKVFPPEIKAVKEKPIKTTHKKTVK
jgi:hypothetical protein